MGIHFKQEDGSLEIYVQGALDHFAHSPFMGIMEEISEETPCHVFLEEVSHIDSSGLGLLLLLHDRTGRVNGRVELHEPNEQVYQTLLNCNFQQIFKIHPKAS
uniref:Putative anti-sigma-factor antagonist n=1 Tax=Magnetococcus massalia (strain MO-1) TaxID=451514 RepID=A0A1S7LKP5_MAGMO|nr:Putative anti-sigma-factor antagonist [Candidatus Magnetococcus massalia]